MFEELLPRLAAMELTGPGAADPHELHERAALDAGPRGPGLVLNRARRRARETLRKNVEVFEGIGYREVGESSAGRVRMESDSGPAIVLSFAGRGRVVGGSFGLEIAAAEPICPATRGLRRARPRRREARADRLQAEGRRRERAPSWPSV